jgi:hypothetical protein
MPFHFCQDELLMILAMIPFIGIFFRKIHIWYHAKFHHKCHEKNCDAEHPEHWLGEHEALHQEFQKSFLSNPNRKLYNLIVPAPSKEWDLISLDDVLDKYGSEITGSLHEKCGQLFYAEDFEWFINSDGTTLMARVRVHNDKRYLYSFSMPEAGWMEW